MKYTIGFIILFKLLLYIFKTVLSKLNLNVIDYKLTRIISHYNLVLYIHNLLQDSKKNKLFESKRRRDKDYILYDEYQLPNKTFVGEWKIFVESDTVSYHKIQAAFILTKMYKCFTIHKNSI